METRNNLIISALIIGAALVISSILFVATWKSNYNANQTITVTGSAKKLIVSDFGMLRGTIMVTGISAEAAYRELQSEKPKLLSYLASKGFPADKVEFFTINSYPIYETSAQGNPTSNVIGYSYSQRLEIESNDVNKIKEISLDISSVIEQGVHFQVEMPEYHYSKIADLKIDVQAAAAKDAMVRANKIAEATGRSLGTMTEARMGVLQITPRLSNQVSDYGINDLSSIEKEITAVVNASFLIK